MFDLQPFCKLDQTLNSDYPLLSWLYVIRGTNHDPIELYILNYLNTGTGGHSCVGSYTVVPILLKALLILNAMFFEIKVRTLFPMLLFNCEIQLKADIEDSNILLRDNFIFEDLV